MRISLIISEENKTLERDISRLMDITTFYMRYYPGHGETPKERRRMLQELSKIKPEIEKADLILYARSYGVFSSEGWKLLHSFFSKPVIISTEEIAKHVREKRVFLVSPYNQYRHDYEVNWLREFSKVVGSVALGRTGGDAISSTPPHLVENAVKIGHENPEAEIVYVACTILSTLPYLDRLKGGKPVITASSVLIEGVKWDG